MLKKLWSCRLPGTPAEMRVCYGYELLASAWLNGLVLLLWGVVLPCLFLAKPSGQDNWLMFVLVAIGLHPAAILFWCYREVKSRRSLGLRDEDVARRVAEPNRVPRLVLRIFLFFTQEIWSWRWNRRRRLP